MPNKILVLTFYYPPDLCAGSFRASAMVDALRRTSGGHVDVEVLTTMPNRYQSFRRDADELEVDRELTVCRLPTHTHKSGFIDQARSFLGFARQALAHVRGRDYDLVYATSSRLMTAALGAIISRRKKAPLYLDIRDLFADTIQDMFAGRIAYLMVPMIRALEKYTFDTATTINVVSPGFQAYFDDRGYGHRLRFFTNGIDDEFLDYDFSRAISPRERAVILYAGNIGAGQGLDRLIPDAARLLRGSHEFVVVGDGGAKAELVGACEALDNVRIEPPVDRDTLKELYASADILLIHLNDYDAFRKVLPSKIFEYAATGKPILAGVAGYAAEFTRDSVENAVVFPPCDARAMVSALGLLSPVPVPRTRFCREFARGDIMIKLAADVVALLDDESACVPSAVS